MQFAFLLACLVGCCIFGGAHSIPVDPCNVYKNCTECLYNAEYCGWCGSNGKCMSANQTDPYAGPDVETYGVKCASLYDPSIPPNRWEYKTSVVLGNNNRSDGILFPTEFYVYLRPGIPVNVTVQLVVPAIPPIDLLILQDASYSMLSSIQTVQILVPAISVALRNLTAKSTACRANVSDCVWFGQSMYLEKPQAPFANYPESFTYLPVTRLTPDANLFIEGLNKSQKLLARNYEHPEDPFEAILMATGRSAAGNTGTDETGFRYGTGVFHIAMVITDAAAHIAGDGLHLGIFTPNNGDGVLDGYPPGTGEDYPSIEMVRQAFVKTDVSPLFAAASRVVGFYRDVVTQFGFGGTAELTTNSTQFLQEILKGTQEILSKAALSVTDDPLSRFLEFAYPPGGVYLGVKGDDVLYFTITVLAPLDLVEAFGQDGDITLKYVGFGNRVVIHTYMNVTCVGCSPNNDTVQVDFCGICGGSNLCIGCDGILQIPPVINDVCGVCGGRNETCMGCNGTLIPLGGAQYDACNVCGGDNSTCIGCDGVINSGKIFNDCTPRVCGGPPNCEITTAIVALGVTVAIVGIVAAILAIIFCATFGAAIANADKVMLDKEAKLQENPLYEEAKKKFDNPLYTPTYNS